MATFKVGDVIMSIKNQCNTFEVVRADSGLYKLKVLSHRNSDRWKIGSEITFDQGLVHGKVRLISKLDKVLR